jgi:hypothetical protein
MTTFAEDVRGEIAMTALGATEGQRVDALQAAFACADAAVLDEAAVQAMIARDAKRQMAVPDVMKVRRGRHWPFSSVSSKRTK